MGQCTVIKIYKEYENINEMWKDIKIFLKYKIIHVWSHVDVGQKPTQYCKAIILQLKKTILHGFLKRAKK